jgi:hypothetical protein
MIFAIKISVSLDSGWPHAALVSHGIVKELLKKPQAEKAISAWIVAPTRCVWAAFQ